VKENGTICYKERRREGFRGVNKEEGEEREGKENEIVRRWKAKRRKKEVGTLTARRRKPIEVKEEKIGEKKTHKKAERQLCYIKKI
jgi:hypothetical protein